MKKPSQSLSAKSIEKLWGEGPYSEVNLKIQTRILDDSISRIFLEVEVCVNPYTFELIKKYRKLFENDQMIQDILDHSDYRGPSFGYVSLAYLNEYNKDLLEEANLHLRYAESTVMKMHKFVLRYLSGETN